MSVRVSSRSLAALTAVAVVAQISQVPAPAAEAAPVADLNQGDLIYNVSNGQECAVGWLRDGYAFTAGQCGSDGDLFRDIDNNYLGSFETLYDPETRRNDFGWIKLDMDVAEGDNEYELDEFDAVRGAVLLSRQAPDGSLAVSWNYGFDGGTVVADNDIAAASPVLGEPVLANGRSLAGLFTGEMGGYSLITRPDRIVESPHAVDPAYIEARYGDAQHAEVREFSPAAGVGEQVVFPGPAAVDQGMPIINVGKGRCTAGFLADGVVYSAGHCGSEGDEIWLGNDDFRPLERIGTFHTKYQEDETLPEDDRTKIRNDHGYITVDSPWVKLGENTFSGDSVVPYEDITPGLEVCAYGQTTKPRIRCGEVRGVDGADIVMTDSVVGKPGDSGGPVWAKDGSGLVGIFSGGAKDETAASASYPYAETDNNNRISLDMKGVLRSFELGVPYYSIFAVYRTLLGLRGEAIPVPAQVIKQGDFLYNADGKPVCRVGYVDDNRLYFATDCGHKYLYTVLGREVAVVEGGAYQNHRTATTTLVDSYWGEGENLPGADRIVPWDELAPGDPICTTGKTSGEEACTTLLGFDGPRLVLERPFEGDFAIPGGPLWIPGKGFAGVYTGSRDQWGRGMRIDMTFVQGREFSHAAEVALAYDLDEPYYQKTPAMFVDAELQPTQPVPFPERTFKAGETLYDWYGDAICEITSVEDGHLVVSSECGWDVFTRLGDLVGQLEKPSTVSDQVATIPVTGNFMSAGDNSTTALIPWTDLTPGDEVCAGDACTEFAGYDGSKLVLVDDLPGVLPGAGLHVKGKGLAGVYHRDGIGSRTDMIDDGWASPNTEQIREARRKGEQFFAHNDANFWSRAGGEGAVVPFPSRKLDEGTLLYDASGAPTCIIGRVEDEHLYVSANCQSDGFFTAAGEYVGDLEVPAAATERTSPGIIAVTGRRMEPGANTHLEHAAWDELQPGDELCSDAGCGTFFGLDGAQIIHDAPVPAQPGAALWNPQKGFVGVSGAGGEATRIDMLTSEAPTDSAAAVKRAHELGVRFYQRASANFWSPNHYGGEVPFERHPRINQGDLLYDASGDPRCSISLIQDDVLFTSPDCAPSGDTLYSEFGEPLGQLTVPAADTTTRNKFAYVELDTPFVQPGSNGVTGDDVVEWSDANPGDEVCVSTASGERCGTYLGQDGSAVVLSDGLTDSADHADPRTIGAPVWIPGKGFLAVYAGEVDGFHTGARIDMITRGNPATNFRAVADAHDRNETYYQQVPANFFNVENLDGMTVPFPKKPAPKPTPKPTPVPTEAPSPSPASTTSPAPSSEQPVPATLTTTVPSTTSVAEPTAATPRTETASTTRMTPAKSNVAPAEDSHVSEPEAGNGNDGSANGSSTGGIIAAILIPLVLVGLGFLATQVVDTTQFGLPPVPQILPLKR
ncbi:MULTISPECIES: trypsin-like serine protease [Corynebacterium]|uniref:Trypsin-like serine protease n=2 Tax=Corynebacterium TaxID=1716 RepID=A0A7W2EBT6_9CORY|nr:MULTISPECIES: trypsin-like serine protease [Corynebacterium]MBA5244792.1 trypsin-like serine protease [Corynebacterium haemomassiliense]MCZ9292486.1 S1 family peptidase [Corynebacterium lehmanniae]